MADEQKPVAWQRVPIEPTPDMLSAGGSVVLNTGPIEALHVDDRYAGPRGWTMERQPDSDFCLQGRETGAFRIYQAMIEASPLSPEPSSDELSRLRERVAELEGIARTAHDTLEEINPSNYDHDDVCSLNAASVEAILLLADAIGETHGKTVEWWDERRAVLAKREG